MKTVFLSAFVVSLMLVAGKSFGQSESVDDFLGLETELMPPVEGKNNYTKTNLHQEKSWNVNPEEVVLDMTHPNKGQNHSIIQWETQDPEDFLSIRNWIIDRDRKDRIPYWMARMRRSGYQQLFGKVLQCHGTCDVYRGINKASVQHLSRIVEGDELVTGKDSVAWVYNMDGSLLRVSSQSSVTFQEINFGKKETLLLVRLNHGHLYWNPHRSHQEAVNTDPETDSHSLPLLVREANQEFYERSLYKPKDPSSLFTIPEEAAKLQFKELNRLREENGETRTTRFMLIVPNVTLVSMGAPLHAVHVTGGKSWFKKNSSNHVEVYFRSHANANARTLETENWAEMKENGKEYVAMEDPSGELQILELLTKRIKTIELAREIWFKKFTVPLLNSLNDSAVLARDFGQRLWGDDYYSRLNFLLEYTRRIETTNLYALEKLLKKMESKGEKVRKDLNGEFYFASLNHYLLGLKNRYDGKKQKVKGMNDLQYYVWILRNGKY